MILQGRKKRIKLHPMRNVRKAALFLCICFSLFILLLAFHHHADGKSHEDCSICFNVAHHASAALQDIPHISAPVSAVLPVFAEHGASHSRLLSVPCSNRAPPA